MKNNFFNQASRCDEVFDYIETNEEEFKKQWGDKFQLIYDYPCLLSYPTWDSTPPKNCDCCNRPLDVGYDITKTWEGGWRPEVNQFTIYLPLISNLIHLSKFEKSPILDDVNNILTDFRKIDWK
jgi:hypothetical protein